jgi:two-component system response regulator HydG
VLLDYDWPGNIRELENAVERAIVTTRNRSLCAEDFAFLENAMRARANWAVPPIPLQEIEKMAVESALGRSQGNIKEAAAALGIDRSTLYEKIKRFGIQR